MTQPNLFDSMPKATVNAIEGRSPERREQWVSFFDNPDATLTLTFDDDGRMTDFNVRMPKEGRGTGKASELFTGEKNKEAAGAMVGYYFQLRKDGICDPYRGIVPSPEDRRNEYDCDIEGGRRITTFSMAAYHRGEGILATNVIGGIYRYLWKDKGYSFEQVETFFNGFARGGSEFEALNDLFTYLGRGWAKKGKVLTEIDSIRLVAMAWNIYITGNKKKHLPTTIDTDVQFK